MIMANRGTVSITLVWQERQAEPPFDGSNVVVQLGQLS